MGGSLSTSNQTTMVPSTSDKKEVEQQIQSMTSIREINTIDTPIVEEKPVEEKPVEEKPVEEKPVEEKPVEEKPVEEKPVEEKAIEVFERTGQSSKIEIEPVNVSENEDVVKKTKKNKKKNK